MPTEPTRPLTAVLLCVDNAALNAIGGKSFKAENIPLGVVAKNMTKVQQMMDRVGYK